MSPLKLEQAELRRRAPGSDGHCLSDARRVEAALLSRVAGHLLPLGCLGGVRSIEAGDETLLRASEGRGLERAVVAVRQASGAGRELGRSLCLQLGVRVSEIPRLPSRVPSWPIGVVGSIAHDREFAAAAVAPADRFEGIGIDIEPAEPLPSGVASTIGSPGEWAALRRLRLVDRALFCIKEAVYKAVYPRDGVFMEFRDVTVDTASQTAATCYGSTVCWRVRVTSRIVAVAWIRPDRAFTAIE